MLVCHCNAVSDRTIRKVVRAGALTADEVGFACGAGSCCGGCVDTVQQIIHAETGAGELATVDTSSPAAQSKS